MIRPTIGRVVLYWPPVPVGGVQREQPHPALVSHVWSDTCINIGGFDQNGVPFAATSVLLHQGDDTTKPFGQFAEWMPYQKAQAEKHAAEVAPAPSALKTMPVDAELPNRGPRITPADVEANIASEHYFTAADGARFGWLTDDHADSQKRDCVDSIACSIRTSGYGSICGDIDANAGTPIALGLLTFCVLVLANGFTVTGESACAAPENFDAEIGKRIARAQAAAKIWPLMGYELRTRLADDALAHDLS